MNIDLKLKNNFNELEFERIKAFLIDFAICLILFFFINIILDYYLFKKRIFYNEHHWLLDFTGLKQIAVILLFRDLILSGSIGKEIYGLKVQMSKYSNIRYLLLIFRQIPLLISYYLDPLFYLIFRKRIIDKILHISIFKEKEKPTLSYLSVFLKCLFLIFITIILNLTIYIYVKYQYINVLTFNKQKSDDIEYVILHSCPDLIYSVNASFFEKMRRKDSGYLELNLYTFKDYWKKENVDFLKNDIDRLIQVISMNIDTTSNSVEIRLIKDYKTRLRINNFYINFDSTQIQRTGTNYKL